MSNHRLDTPEPRTHRFMAIRVMSSREKSRLALLTSEQVLFNFTIVAVFVHLPFPLITATGRALMLA